MAINKRLIKSNEGAAYSDFNTVLYTGNGSTQSITGVGFQPDFVWIKDRGVTNYHTLQDSVRGEGKSLFSNETVAESGNSNDLISSFDANGFTVNTTYQGASNNPSTNGNNNTYVAWCWKAGGAAVSGTSSHYTNCEISANPDAGFSIVKFTIPSGTVSTTASYNHGLNAAPKLIITKPYNGYFGASSWYSWAEPITTSNYLLLNTTDAAAAGAVFSSVDSSTVKYRFTSNNGGAASDVITYNFTDIDGYQKIGSYTGNSSINTITTGFKPRWVMFKCTSTADYWMIFDSQRGVVQNVTDTYLLANISQEEQDLNNGDSVEFLSDGLKITGDGRYFNLNNETYIYLAIA